MRELVTHIRWHRIKSARMASIIVPPLPGIYAYGEVDGLAGLPKKITWIYIGLAKNLQRRLTQHEHYGETNAEFRRWLTLAGGEAELWYTTLDVQHLKKLEAMLIRQLKPIHNKIQYQRRNGHG